MHGLECFEYSPKFGAADLAVEILGESLEVDVGRIHVAEELGARLGTHISGSDRDAAHAALAGGVSDVDCVFHEYGRVVVSVRDARAAKPLGGGGELRRARAIRERVHLTRLAHVPVLAELAGEVAAGRPEGQDRTAGEEVVEWLLLDRIDAEAARAAIAEELDATRLDTAHEAQAALPFVHPAGARAHVALHPAIRQQVPVTGVDDSVRDVAFGLTQEWTLRSSMNG